MLGMNYDFGLSGPSGYVYAGIAIWHAICFFFGAIMVHSIASVKGKRAKLLFLLIWLPMLITMMMFQTLGQRLWAVTIFQTFNHGGLLWLEYDFPAFTPLIAILAGIIVAMAIVIIKRRKNYSM